MKKFLVFAGTFYYPSGGWNDLQGDYETKEECYEHLKCDASIRKYGQDPNWNCAYDWWHIVEDGCIVEAGWEGRSGVNPWDTNED